MSAELLTFKEARVLLRMSERKLREVIAEREISVIRDGRYLRIERGAIDDYLASRRIAAVPRLRTVPTAPALPPDEAYLEQLMAKHGLKR